MREILFRAKLMFNRGIWVYGDFTTVVGYFPKIISHDNGEMCEVILETVGQYIGLLDKNGTKIFEGDIVRDAETSDVGKIFFDKYAAMFVIGFENTIADFNASYSFEVIGNIYDNPELIGGEVNG
jgi:hypothetical protein